MFAIDSGGMKLYLCFSFKLLKLRLLLATIQNFTIYKKYNACIDQVKSAPSDLFLMSACVKFDKIDNMNHLNRRISNSFNAGTGSSFFIVAAMYSSDTTFNFLVDRVNNSKIRYPISLNLRFPSTFRSFLGLIACEFGNLDVIKYLLELNENIITTFDDENRIFSFNGLHLAALKGKRDTVVFLIEELGMNPAVEDASRRNCFLNACYGGQTDIVKY